MSPKIAAAGLAALLLNGAALAEDGAWKVPRTEWGDPDLSGRWPIDYLAQTPRRTGHRAPSGRGC